MSTRSTIAIKLDDTYHAIYCHFDGYDHDNGVGPTLRKYHSSFEHAKKLIKLGNLSYIHKDEVCSYHKDRGDPWSRCCPRVLNSEEALIRHAKSCDANYMYLCDKGAWVTTKL